MGLHRVGGITSLGFSPHGVISSQEFFYSSSSFPILLLFFLGFASFRLYNSSSAFAVVFFPGKIQVSRLGFVLFPLSRCSRTIPILPSSSSSRMRSWWGCNVASDPGSWNSKPTHPTLGSGAGPEQDLTWSQFHLENPGNFLPEEGR